MYNVPKMNQKLKPNLIFWLWLAVKGLQGAVISFIDYRIGFRFLPPKDVWMLQTIQILLVSVLEWMVLSRFFEKMSFWIWLNWIIQLTFFIIGDIVGIFAGFARSDFGGGGRFQQFLLLANIWYIVTFVVVACIQWLIFNGKVAGSWRWVVALALSWAITKLLFSLHLNFFTIGQSGLETILYLINTLLIDVAIVVPQALVLRQFVIERNRVPAPV